ncbi:MAG: hypothetical protein H0X31_02115 [Nostocaceae cyanobacterium]|nr:hypothetical protein [Nostocaceae cyanobacterium]
MPESPSSPIDIFPFSSFHFANGSYAVQRSAQDIEVWENNLSEHYTIHINDIDDGNVDVIYLGVPPATRP